MREEDIKVLLDKYKAGTITDGEKAVLDQWYLHVAADGSEELSDEERLDTFEQVLVHLNEVIYEKKTRSLWPRIAAAASILLFLSVGTYYLLHQNKPQQVAVNPEQRAPVNNGVVLTLNGGKTIQLLQKHQGLITAIGNTQVKQSDSLLTYQGTATNAAPAMNTLANNSGKKFNLALADGTEVALDVASSITYPVNFTGKRREVSITGQAYFKVRHNAAQPFEVSAKGETIEDIGTEFNVDAYDNPRTTLITGAIKIGSLTLKPGEEAHLAGNELVKGPADLEMATIWLQGKIPLNHRTLEDVLNEVGRIYDVQFNWPDASLKQLKFGGAVSRTQKLSTVLNFFRNTGKVDFIVNGKIVTVLKKKKQ
ncbi:FecR family protein [Mucilaginibacter sp. AW1-3]